jgi:hypothetical protein
MRVLDAAAAYENGGGAAYTRFSPWGEGGP